VNFYYNQFLAKHWNQLVTMVEDNYIAGYNQSDYVVMGLHCHHSMITYKQEIEPDSKLILYQTEPLVSGQHWHSVQKIIDNINGVDEVWDYDFENIDILRSNGIEARFAPPAYSERLKRVNNIDNPDIDVLFYGCHSTHRYEYLRDLITTMKNDETTTDFLMNRNVVWLYNITDDLLDEFIGRSKIILNLKPYEHTVRQQQTRIYYPLINDKCVLSERCNINYFGDTIHEFSGIEEMKQKVVHLLQDDNWRKRKPNHRGWIGAKDKSKIAIFYHVYQVHNWPKVFEEQIGNLQYSGLYDEADYIHIGINGINALPFTLNKVNRVKYNQNHGSEIDTLTDLYNFAKVNPEYRILYFHTKGVSHFNSPYAANVDSWRKYMEYFCITKWRDCIASLVDYDTAGTDWVDMAHINNQILPIPHYGGNFWWASSEYISKLDIKYLSEETPWKRYNCEFWIGSKQPNKFNFHTTNVGKYENYIEPNSYWRI
jgi:hypothetical protein